MIASQSASSVSSSPFECGPATIALFTITSSRPGALAPRRGRAVDVVPARRVRVDELALPPCSAIRSIVVRPALARRLAHVADHHVRALAREGESHGAPDPGGSAGDDRGLPGESRAQLSNPIASPPSISSVMPLM